MGRFKKRLVLLTEAEEQAKKKQETLKKQNGIPEDGIPFCFFNVSCFFFA